MFRDAGQPDYAHPCSCDRPFVVDRECFKCGRVINSAARDRATASRVPLVARPRTPAPLTRVPVLIPDRPRWSPGRRAERPTHCLACTNELPPPKDIGRVRLYCGPACRRRGAAAVQRQRMKDADDAARVALCEARLGGILSEHLAFTA